jgi:hypothetical protein
MMDSINENDRLLHLYTDCGEPCDHPDQLYDLAVRASKLIVEKKRGLHDHVVIIWAFMHFIQTDPNFVSMVVGMLEELIPNIRYSKLSSWHYAIQDKLNRDPKHWLDCNDSTLECGVGSRGVLRHIISDAFLRSEYSTPTMSKAESAFVTASVLHVLKIAKGLNMENSSGVLQTLFSTYPSDLFAGEIPMDLIAYHYETIRRCLYSDRLQRMPAQIRAKRGDNTKFQCVAQGPNGSCFAAAALNLFVNTPAFMQRLEILRTTDESVQHLWTELEELRRSGGGLSNILGPSTPCGLTKEEREVCKEDESKQPAWPMTRFGRALVDLVETEEQDGYVSRRLHDLEGGLPVPIFTGILEMVGIPVVNPGEEQTNTRPIVKISQYNPEEHLRNLYIAMHAPASEFIGVFLSTNHN